MAIISLGRGQVARVDNSLLETIATAKKEFDAITGGARGLTAKGQLQGKAKKNSQERGQREKERSNEMEAIKKKQQEDEDRARAEAAEEMAEKERALEKQKQEMLEKMQQSKTQMADKPPKKKKKKKEKTKKPPKDQGQQEPLPYVLPDPSTTTTTTSPTTTDNLAAGPAPAAAPELQSALSSPAQQVAEPASASYAVQEKGHKESAAATAASETTATAATATASTPAPGSQPVVELYPLPTLPEPTIVPPAQAQASGTVANITPEAPTPFITQSQAVETATQYHSVQMQKLKEEEEEEYETDGDEEEDESDDDEEEMQRELQRQHEEMEAQIRQIEEQHRREIQAVRDQEEERRQKARLDAAQELARLTSTHGSSDSDDSEEYGERETHGVITNIENTLSNTNYAVSGIQQVIKEQHDEMAKILQNKAQESKAEVSKTKAAYQMKLAVGLFKAQHPQAPAPIQEAAAPPPAPVAPKPSTPPLREEIPLPLIQPLSKATTLPAGNAPTSGWLPTSRPPRHPSKQIRVLRAPVVLQKEYAEHLGGQHRISTAALPMQPWFAEPKKPPSLQFQPKHFYYGSDKPQQNVQRPSTARARLQRDGSQSPVKPNSVDSTVHMEAVSSGSPPRSAGREVYGSLFPDSASASRQRRPMSAHTQRENTDYQDALKKIHGVDRVDGCHVLLPIGTQVNLRQFGSDKNPFHVSQYKGQQWNEGFKGSPAKGRRRHESAYSAHPPTTPRLTSGERERQIGGILASSPAPVAWTTGRDSKDPDFINTIVGSTSRLQIRPQNVSNRGQGSQAGTFKHLAMSRNDSKSFTPRPPQSPSHKIQLFH